MRYRTPPHLRHERDEPRRDYRDERRGRSRERSRGRSRERSRERSLERVEKHSLERKRSPSRDAKAGAPAITDEREFAKVLHERERSLSPRPFIERHHDAEDEY